MTDPIGTGSRSPLPGAGGIADVELGAPAAPTPGSSADETAPPGAPAPTRPRSSNFSAEALESRLAARLASSAASEVAALRSGPSAALREFMAKAVSWGERNGKWKSGKLDPTSTDSRDSTFTFARMQLALERLASGRPFEDPIAFRVPHPAWKYGPKDIEHRDIHKVAEQAWKDAQAKHPDDEQKQYAAFVGAMRNEYANTQINLAEIQKAATSNFSRGTYAREWQAFVKKHVVPAMTNDDAFLGVVAPLLD